METIGNNFKQAINDNFRYHLMERTAKGVADIMFGNIRTTATMHLLPKAESITLDKIDDLHDKIVLGWADYSIEGVLTWKPSNNKMVFCGIE